MGENILTAPKDGSTIIGIFSDGSELEMRWAEERRCMLAGVGGGNGYFGAGWEDIENHLVVLDEPVAWKPIQILRTQEGVE